MRNQLIELQPLFGGVLIRDLEGLVACGLIVQRLQTDVRHVSTADALADSVPLCTARKKHKRENQQETTKKLERKP